MWPFTVKTRQRRREVRKSLAQSRRSPWQRFRAANGPAGLAMGVAFYLAALMLNLWPIDPLPYQEGQYLPTDVRARVGFELPRPKAFAVPSGEGEAPAAFRLNDDLLRLLERKLRGLPDRFAVAPSPSTTRPTTVPATQPTETTTRPVIDRASAAAILGAPAGRERYQTRVDALLIELRKQPIVSAEQAKIQRERRAERILLHGAVAEMAEPLAPEVSQLVPLDEPEAVERMASSLATAARFEPSVARHVRSALEETFSPQGDPLYVYMPPPSPAIRATDEPEGISPGDMLARGSRQRLASGEEEVVALTARELELLRHEHEAYLRQERESEPWRLWARLGGRTVLLLLLTLAAAAYAARYEPQLFHEPWRGLAVAATLLLMLGLAKLMGVALQWNPHAAILPVVMTAMVLAIAFDQRFALAFGTVMILLTVLQQRTDLGVALALAGGTAAAVFPLREIRTRSKLVEVAALTALAAFAVVWMYGWASGVPWRFVLRDGLWAGGFGLLAGFLLQGLLPVVERIFGVATSMTLLEWCDASKPLLRHLAIQAPGTYNHSLQLGALCEAAADAIDARGLLARAGAYYHDIGKANKPEYFVENQAGSASKHAKLSPAMSLLIITGHVKDGLEMAREYRLPRVLHEFIATHHGTTVMQYFYHAATEQSKRNGNGRAPQEEEFRHPGPKPQSKEAAILMLADGAESSVRAMTDPTPSRIEGQVHTIVQRRLTDGQLDECELTLREVHTIEASLVRSLCAIYHGRIAYPAPAGQKPSAAEFASEKPPAPRPEPQEQPAGAGNGGQPARDPDLTEEVTES